jgi:hypothetical protein
MIHCMHCNFIIECKIDKSIIICTIEKHDDQPEAPIVDALGLTYTYGTAAPQIYRKRVGSWIGHS